MPTFKNYFLPDTIQKALRALHEAPGPVSLIAGGTDLLLDLQQGRHAPVDALIDVTDIPELKMLELQGEQTYIGAAVPLRTIAASALVREHAQALSEACSLIGGPQVRNTATLGGNVAHALPAADGTIGLLALGAQALVADLQGMRQAPLATLFLGPGRSALKAGQEMLVAFLLPKRQLGQASAFSRIMRPQGVALPILNMAIWLERKDDCIADIRIAVGPGGPTPQRALAAEEFLRGKPASDGVLDQALTEMLETMKFRTSPHRASSDYRRHLCGVLLREVFAIAWGRAAETVKVVA